MPTSRALIVCFAKLFRRAEFNSKTRSESQPHGPYSLLTDV
jgi:hypothetical protein